jgi:hypothetical protein
MSNFKIQHLFLILLVAVAGRSCYFGFDWESALGMLVLGGLFVTMDLMIRFFQAKKEVQSENDFRAKVISEIESIKGQIGTVKLAQMNTNKSIKHTMQF